MIDTFKKIMGHYPTGVTIVTTLDNDTPIGLTVNSFASVSIDPLLVLWSIDKNSRSLDSFLNADAFAINILSDHQKELCYLFAGNEKDERFTDTNWQLSENNLPMINDMFGMLECKKHQQIDAGDHYILIGEVFHIKKNETKPLMYYNRKVQPVIVES